jgi:outer membrane lipoprotein SlyB
MLTKPLLALTALSMAVPVTAPAFQAEARHHTTQYSRHYYTTSNGIRYWRGNNGRYYCRRSNGTVGLLVGGAAGALIGHAVDGGRSHVTGTIVGAAAGALIGRSIARNHVSCR